MKWAPEVEDDAPWSGWTPTSEFVEACKQRDRAYDCAVVLEQENARLRHDISRIRAHIESSVAVGDAWKCRGLDLCDLALLADHLTPVVAGSVALQPPAPNEASR